MHLNLLIFCVVLSQAIIGTISSENITESSDLLVRKKRVLNIVNGNEGIVRPGEFPFIVNIKMLRKAHCVGSILSSFTVITSASCAAEHVSMYQLFSGSIHIQRGSSHSIIGKKIRFGNHMRGRTIDGIALLTVNPPFMPRHTGTIQLHVGPILPGLPATVLGWGHYYIPGERGTDHPRDLRSITVPIMPHRECVNAYRGFYDINDEDVCTYDSEKHCCGSDFGAPLIIDGQLSGIYLWRQNHQNIQRAPEVFVVLQHEHYRQWIRDNIVHGN